jgi:hypothetical protein
MQGPSHRSRKLCSFVKYGMADFDHDDHHSSLIAETFEDYRQRYVTTHRIANTKRPDRRRDEKPSIRDRIGPFTVICLASSRIIGTVLQNHISDKSARVELTT